MNSKRFIIDLDVDPCHIKRYAESACKDMVALATGTLIGDHVDECGYKIRRASANWIPAAEFFAGNTYEPGDRVPGIGTLAKVGQRNYCVLNDDFEIIGERYVTDCEITDATIKCMTGKSPDTKPATLRPGDRVSVDTCGYILARLGDRIGLIGMSSGDLVHTIPMTEGYKITMSDLKKLLMDVDMKCVRVMKC